MKKAFAVSAVCGGGGLRSAHASAQAPTNSKPAVRRAAAHASRVAPVVTTSSTSTTRARALDWGGRATKACSALCFRAFLSSWAWARVLLGRDSESKSTRLDDARAAARAMSAAWLYPRSARRSGWSGTGTRCAPCQAEKSDIPRASPNGEARRVSCPYLRARTMRPKSL